MNTFLNTSKTLIKLTVLLFSMNLIAGVVTKPVQNNQTTKFSSNINKNKELLAAVPNDLSNFGLNQGNSFTMPLLLENMLLVLKDSKASFQKEGYAAEYSNAKKSSTKSNDQALFLYNWNGYMKNVRDGNSGLPALFDNVMNKKFDFDKNTTRDYLRGVSSFQVPAGARNISPLNDASSWIYLFFNMFYWYASSIANIDATTLTGAGDKTVTMSPNLKQFSANNAKYNNLWLFTSGDLIPIFNFLTSTYFPTLSVLKVTGYKSNILTNLTFNIAAGKGLTTAQVAKAKAEQAGFGLQSKQFINRSGLKQDSDKGFIFKGNSFSQQFYNPLLEYGSYPTLLESDPTYTLALGLYFNSSIVPNPIAPKNGVDNTLLAWLLPLVILLSIAGTIGADKGFRKLKASQESNKNKKTTK